MENHPASRAERLRGKVALVTGGSRGIGRAIAIRFAEEGADIVINYANNTDAAEKTAAEIRGLGRRCQPIRADVSSSGGPRTLIRDALKAMGSLDILVNNAGVEKQAPFGEVTEEDYDRVLNTNLRGPFFTSQEFARALIERKTPGRIINISSVHEDLPFPRFASYCASKGGLKMLTRNIAIELARHKITVNSVAPGAIETDINRSLLNDKPRMRALLEQIPARRMGKPEEVAAVAAFLASPEAEYVTGATYFIDGGLTWDYEE